MSDDNRSKMYTPVPGTYRGAGVIEDAEHGDLVYGEGAVELRSKPCPAHRPLTAILTIAAGTALGLIVGVVILGLVDAARP